MLILINCCYFKCISPFIYFSCIQSRRNWFSSPMSTNLLLTLIGIRGDDKYLQVYKYLKDVQGFETKTKVFVSTEYKLNVPQGISIESEQIDFNKPGAKEEVSEWVSKYGFKNCDPNKYVASSTKYALLNVATLQMSWHSTKESGALMTVYNTFSYTEDIKYEARILELPLQNKDFKIIILVPNEPDVLYSLFNVLTNEGLNSAVASIQPLFTAQSELKAPNIEFQAFSELDLQQRNFGISTGTKINVGNVKINESGAFIKCLTCIFSKTENQHSIKPQTTETCENNLRPFLFAINYNDNPIFTGQFAA